jgi:uncharacterized protein
MASAPTTWVLTDGRIGNERQALALARGLAVVEPRVWRLDARKPWRWMAPRKLPGNRRAFGDEFLHALRKPPTLAIGCGRQAALATRLLRDAGARSVQILDPRLGSRHWDAVIVPEHDRLRGPNVVTTLGGLHEVDADWLAQARARFPQFARLHSPRALLLLGGPVADVPLDEAWWSRTVEVLRTRHLLHGGSLSICASPRTPTWMVESARHDLSDLHGAHWLVSQDGPNPYPGLLGWAEDIIASPDSVNMISEACATSARVSIAAPELANGRHASFLRSLAERKRVVALGTELAEDEPATPLVELPRVVAAVRALLGQ